MAENQELRDLCCFLDDEIQRCRKLAHEWQSFGKYTAAVLRHEVLGFESKIQILTVSHLNQCTCTCMINKECQVWSIILHYSIKINLYCHQ